MLVASTGYRTYRSPETGTGSLTLPQPAPDTGENGPIFEAASPDGRSFELSEKGVYVSNIPKGEEDVPYTVLQDDSEQLTAIYNAKRVRRLLLINNGIIELAQNGYHPENEEHLREELDRVLTDET